MNPAICDVFPALLSIPFLLVAGAIVVWILAGTRAVRPASGPLHGRARTGFGDRFAEHVEVRVRTRAGKLAIALVLLAGLSYSLYTHVGLLFLPSVCS